MGKRRKKRSAKRKQKFADKLNENLPESEKWFWAEWERIGMKHGEDQANEILCGFIPDVLNHKYKYVIEVDGLIHIKKKIKKRDEIKNEVFSKNGFSVFRLEAYNDYQLGILADEVEKIRTKEDRKQIKKYILRKS